jgi:hypothetical protein
MSDKFNPFRPDKMCPPGIFSGRYAELRTIDHCLTQTKAGNPQHFLIDGERGIGKSSLLLCEQLVASGQLDTFSKARLNFIVVSISLSQKDDHFSIVRRIAAELKRQLQERNMIQTIASGVMDLLTRVEAAGFRLNKDERKVDESELLSQLQNEMGKLIGGLGETADGVLLVIDEADKPPSEAGLGLICKLLTEELTRRRTERLCIGIAGLPNVIEKLRQSHESSPRFFQTMELKALEFPERELVLDHGLQEAIRKPAQALVGDPSQPVELTIRWLTAAEVKALPMTGEGDFD